MEENEHADNLDGVMEDHFQGGMTANKGLLFAGDLPLVVWSTKKDGDSWRRIFCVPLVLVII